MDISNLKIPSSFHRSSHPAVLQWLHPFALQIVFQAWRELFFLCIPNPPPVRYSSGFNMSRDCCMPPGVTPHSLNALLLWNSLKVAVRQWLHQPLPSMPSQNNETVFMSKWGLAELLISVLGGIGPKSRIESTLLTFYEHQLKADLKTLKIAHCLCPLFSPKNSGLYSKFV